MQKKDFVETNGSTGDAVAVARHIATAATSAAQRHESLMAVDHTGGPNSVLHDLQIRTKLARNSILSDQYTVTRSTPLSRDLQAEKRFIDCRLMQYVAIYVMINMQLLKAVSHTPALTYRHKPAQTACYVPRSCESIIEGRAVANWTRAQTVFFGAPKIGEGLPALAEVSAVTDVTGC